MRRRPHIFEKLKTSGSRASPNRSDDDNNSTSDHLIYAKMTLFILTETSAGYALFKAKDKKLLKNEKLAEEASTAEGVCSM